MDMNENENGNLIIFIVAITSIIVITLVLGSGSKSNIPKPPPLRESLDDTVVYVAPRELPLDADYTYVYYPNDEVYLIPYDELDWSIPYHRWMYLHYPYFYNDYYGIPVIYDIDYHYNHWWNCRHGRCDWPWHNWAWPWWTGGSSGSTWSPDRYHHRYPYRNYDSDPKTGKGGYSGSPRKHPLSTSYTSPSLPRRNLASGKTLTPRKTSSSGNLPYARSASPTTPRSRERFLELDEETGQCKYGILMPAPYNSVPEYAKSDQENFVQLNPKTGLCQSSILDPSGYDDIPDFAVPDPKKDLLL